MIISKKLTAERLEQIKNYPISYDEDSPKLTEAQIARLKPLHEEYWYITPVKKNYIHKNRCGYSCCTAVVRPRLSNQNKRDFTGSGNEREDIDSGRRESPSGRVLPARSLQAGSLAFGGIRAASSSPCSALVRFDSLCLKGANRI